LFFASGWVLSFGGSSCRQKTSRVLDGILLSGRSQKPQHFFIVFPVIQLSAIESRHPKQHSLFVIECFGVLSETVKDR
jgi:hypothetical protein